MEECVEKKCIYKGIHVSGFKRKGPQAATCVDGIWSPYVNTECVQGKYPKLMYIFRGKRDTSLMASEQDSDSTKSLVDTEGKYDHFDKGTIQSYPISSVNSWVVIHFLPRIFPRAFEAVFLYRADCLSCPANAVQVSEASCSIWVAITK